MCSRRAHVHGLPGSTALPATSMCLLPCFPICDRRSSGRYVIRICCPRHQMGVAGSRQSNVLIGSCELAGSRYVNDSLISPRWLKTVRSSRAFACFRIRIRSAPARQSALSNPAIRDVGQEKRNLKHYSGKACEWCKTSCPGATRYLYDPRIRRDRR
jgi:hypothetical protein